MRRVTWLDGCPWGLKEARRIGHFDASGIDKKTVHGEPLVRMVNYTDVYGNQSAIINNQLDFMVVSAPPDKVARFQLAPGDVLITPSSETSEDIGAAVVVAGELEGTVFSYHLLRFKPGDLLFSGFSKYLFNCKPVQQQLARRSKGTTRQILTRDDFKGLLLPIPPLSNQKAIADYLDRKTAAIDAVIEKKRQLLERLAEQRAALINQAVTKGLNPDAPMKDSGIPWIGEVPAHWGVVAISWFSRIFNGSTPSRARLKYWDGSIPWLSSGKVNDWIVTEPSAYISEEGFRNSSLTMVPAGSVVIGMVGQGRTRGMAARLGIEACINQNMAAIIPGDKLDSAFLHYALVQGYKHNREFGRGGQQDALNCSLVGAIRIPFPPIDEQRRISIHLDKMAERKRQVEAFLETQLTRLQEYRQSLITAAVTGQLDIEDDV